MDSNLEGILLSCIIALPFGAALLLALTVRALPDPVWRGFGLGASALEFLMALVLWVGFDPEEPGYQFVERAEWIPDWGIHYFVGVDGISLVLVMLTTLLVPVVLLASWNDVQRSQRSWVFFMLALESGMLGAFLSLNLFLFYVFWEVMLVPMYFIIGIWGGPRRIYAAIKFFLFTMSGSLLMLVAVLVLYRLNWEQGGALNLDLVALPGSGALGLLDTQIPIAGDAPWWKTQLWLFGGFALAFAIKVPLVPFHTWLPDAHVEAPTGGSVLLAGVLLKMGTYGFVRFALPLFPAAAEAAAGTMIGLAVVGIVYGSLVAMVQRDVKKLVAYSSVAHLGFVVLGIFSLNEHGLTGGVLQMVNHGLSTGALFLLVGFLYERRHTREIGEFGGLARVMPVYAALFGIVAMSSIGLPGLNGFVGEFLILLGAFAADRWAAVVATSGVVLAAVYMLWMYRRLVFGPLEKPENRGLIDLDRRECAAVVALLVPIFWIGLYPDPMLRRIEPSVVATLRQMELRESEHESVPEPPLEERDGGETRAAEARADRALLARLAEIR